MAGFDLQLTIFDDEVLPGPPFKRADRIRKTPNKAAIFPTNHNIIEISGIRDADRSALWRSLPLADIRSMVIAAHYGRLWCGPYFDCLVG